ncbi:MAG: SET domain-containing protein-lysine N-methyltransferase [Patescibacteria group bacterium]
MQNVTIGKGNLSGKGVYAARNFESGEVVIKYNLRPLSQEEFNALPANKKDFVHIHKGIIHLYGEPERYINHSPNPNTKQDFINWCDIAVKDIKEGEAITTDSTKDDTD